MYQQVKLDELCVHKIETISSDENGLIDYFDIASVDNTKKKIISHQSLKIEEAPSRAKQIVQLNDILVSTVRPNLNAVTIIDNETKNKMVASTGFCVLRASEKIEPRYLFYFVQSPTFINSMTAQATGASYPAVSNSIVKSSHIPLPDLPTQRRIADTLDKVSEGIEVCRRMLGELDLMVKAKFVEMFGEPIANTHSLPLIPLSEIGNWSSGGTPSRSTPAYFEGNIDWYSAGELNTLYLEGSIEKITQDALENSTAKLFSAGSMLVGMYDTAALKMGILKRSSASNQACACIEPNDNIDIVWLYHVLQIMKPHFLEQRRGIRQKNLNLGMIKSFQVPYAPKSEQKLFASFVTKIDKSKLTIQGIRDKMEMEKLALMQEYFK